MPRKAEARHRPFAYGFANPLGLILGALASLLSGTTGPLLSSTVQHPASPVPLTAMAVASSRITTSSPVQGVPVLPPPTGKRTGAFFDAGPFVTHADLGKLAAALTAAMAANSNDFAGSPLYRALSGSVDNVSRKYLSIDGGTLRHDLTVKGTLVVNGVTGLTAADVPDLSGTYLSTNGGTISGSLIVTGTFSGATLGLTSASSTRLSVTGPAYFGATATSTFGTDGSLTLALALGAASGGTSISNPLAAGILVGSYGGGSWQQLATSSLGLLTTNISEGANLYWTNTRFDNRLAGTTTLPNITSLTNLAAVGAITSGTWNGTTISTAYGGTGTSTWQTGSISFFNGTNLTEDSGNLYWDGTNHRLGIGTTSPFALISLTGQPGINALAISTSSDAATALRVSKNGNLQFSNGAGIDIGNGVPPPSNGLIVAGNLGIGTTSPGALLSVNGNILSTGTLALTGTSGTTTIASGQGFTIGSQFVVQQGSGKVGIGTTALTPSGVLEVSGSGAAPSTGPITQFTNTNPTNNNDSQLSFRSQSNLGNFKDYAYIRGYFIDHTDAAELGALSFATRNGANVNEAMRITSSGYMGVGTTTPYSRLEVWGPDTASTTALSVVNNASTTVFAVFDSGNSTYSGSIFQSSDARLKTDIATLNASSTLAAIGNLNPVSYTRIDQPGTGENLGFLAQQVETIFPELVSTTSPTPLTPGGTLILNYQGLIAPMVSAIQEITNIGGLYKGNLIAWLASANNGINDFSTKHIYGDTLTLNKELCMKAYDGKAMCLTGDELRNLLERANLASSAVPPDPSPIATTTDSTSSAILPTDYHDDLK